jgi:hypothetical protein
LVTLSGTGTAWGNGPVSLEWRLFGVPDAGSCVLLRDFSTANPTDGTFNEGVEGFSISDFRFDMGLVAYDLEFRATAGGFSTTRTIRVVIDR